MNVAPTIDTRIFVVGFPRSGTTLVQSLLASHSMATSFTESHFFWRHFTRLPWLGTTILTRNPVPRLREFLIENDERPTETAHRIETAVHAKRATGPLLALQTQAIARQLLKVLDELTHRRHRARWIEKTPRHLHYVPFIERASAEEARTRFVHVIRDGVDAVASLHDASRNWERHYDLETCVRRWNTDVGLSLKRVDRPSDHFVFYEELTTRPEATLRRLLGELDLPWEESILERFGPVASQLATSQETWKADMSGAIRPSQSASLALSAEQRLHVEKGLRRDLYQRLRGIRAT
jgi:hypothetical protein